MSYISHECMRPLNFYMLYRPVNQTLRSFSQAPLETVQTTHLHSALSISLELYCEPVEF